jgi:hypothetical protein
MLPKSNQPSKLKLRSRDYCYLRCFGFENQFSTGKKSRKIDFQGVRQVIARLIQEHPNAKKVCFSSKQAFLGVI